ncbi:MAG: electron transfer flavoprotein subunit alpha/FixB family protein [Desulfuromonadales bacterium]
MKALLVGETRQGTLLDASYEALAFARKMGAEAVHFLVGKPGQEPRVDGRLYLADDDRFGEYSPETHKALLLEVIRQESPDLVVFSHSSYGWDLAPRLALALQAAQVSEVVDYVDGAFIAPLCNAKLRRRVTPRTPVTVVTLQAGAFSVAEEAAGSPSVVPVQIDAAGKIEFLGFEEVEQGGVDLTKAEVIVSAGRGIGKSENLVLVENLAKALHGEYGASRPVVDAGWVDHNRQVGSTGQSVSPKLYVACGISGAIQHLAGMKKSEFVVAINKDKEAPISEVADVLVVADVMQFVPVLTEKLKAL